MIGTVLTGQCYDCGLMLRITSTPGTEFRALLASGVLCCAALAAAGPAAAPQDSVEASPVQTGRVFASSFESVNDFAGHYIEPPGHLGTASHELSTDQVVSGTYSHKGWIYGANPPDSSHRAYPTVQFHPMPGGAYDCPCTVRLWAWLDMPLDEPGEWFSFVTLSRNPSDTNWDAVGVNVSAANPAPGTVAGGVLHWMHVPTNGLRQPWFQSSTVQFPSQQWVEITMYFDMDATNGWGAVWQDDELVSVAPIRGGTGKLEQAHFGLYAHHNVASGVVYNDDLEIVEGAESPDNDGDTEGDLIDNCPTHANGAQTDSDGDALGDACEASSGTSASNADTDGDNCVDGRESRVLTFTPQQGGARDPLSAWDFYDVPAPAGPALGADGKPVLAPSAARNAVVSLQDVAVVLAYVGRTSSNAAYAADSNTDGLADGQQLDRTPAPAFTPLWRSGAPNGAISLQDVGVALAQVGHKCVV